MRQLVVLMCFFLTACVQNGVKQQSEIKNTPGENYLDVKGTKFSMIPPDGFTAASNFNGFEHMSSGSSIMLSEIPGGPYSEISKGFDREKLKSVGVILKSKEKVVINGLEGVLISGEQFARGVMYSKKILAFGSDTLSFVVNGIYPKELPELGDGIKEAMLSVIYSPEKEVSLTEAVNFELNVSNTKLQLAKAMSKGLFYSVDGEMPTKSADKTFILAGPSFAKVIIEDKKLFAINRLKQLPTIADIQAENVKEITIDSISGYEIISYGQDDSSGEKELVYQVILFSDNIYYLIIGKAESDFEENIKLFKKVTKTFRRKR